MVVRFLPSQEWSTGERESIGEYGIIAARRCIVACTVAKTHTLPLPPQTIPAEAGNLQGQRPSPPHVATQHCEIPAYAGMVHGETKIYRRIRHYRRPPTNCRPHRHQNTPTHSRYPPHRPFLRKQESLFTRRQRRSFLAALPLLLIEIPAFAGMSCGEQECVGELATVRAII